MANVSPLKMRTTVVFTRVLKAEMEAQASKRGVPMGEILRRALTEFIERDKASPGEQEQEIEEEMA
jgi:hypothetical protein